MWMPSRLALAMLIVVAATLLAACQGGGDAGPPTPTATATANIEASPTSMTPTEPATPTPSGERVASTAAIPTADLPVVRFTTGAGETVDLPVEVPPASEYSIGLSGRYELDGRGMVFYYPGESGGPGFWMRNTHIDLDIAFVSGDLRIISVHQMQAESEEIHHPGGAYLAGIEAPLGWYESNGIEAGDRVEFLFAPEDYLQ